MPASITINQATLPAGVAGRARSDGVAAQLVTCSNATAEGSYLWTLVDVPIRSALVRGTTGVAATFTFTPDVKGTYLVRLQVNGSSAAGDNDESYLAIRTSGAKTLSWRYKAQGETTADNESYAGLNFPSNVNPRGWATDEDLVYEEVEESVWETQNAITAFAGVVTRVVKTDAATGKIDPTLVTGGPPTGVAGGDLSGSYPNPSVAGLRGRAIITPFIPVDGQTIWWNNATSQFELSSDLLTTATGVSGAFQDGVVGTPSIRFKSELSTGLFKSGVGQLGVAAVGIEVMRFQAPGALNPQALLASGSSTRPSLSFSAAPTHGLYYDAGGGRIGFVHSSNVRMLLASTYLTPNASNAMDLGITSAPWKIGYIDRVRANAGTALLPALAANADVDTGIYWPGLDQLSIATGGVETARFIADGIRVPDGTATVPAVSGLVSTTTGFSFVSGQISFIVGGAREALMGSGSLQPAVAGGLALGGSTVPWSRAFVQAGTAALPSISVGDDNSGLYLPAADNLAITTAGAEVARFNSSLVAATGDETAIALSATVNKATSGNYTGLSLNVIETAAPGTDDRLLDLKVGSVSQIHVTNDGRIRGPSASVMSPTYAFSADTDTGMYLFNTGIGALVAGGIISVRFQTNGLFPPTTNTHALGTSSLRWSDVRSVLLTAGDALGSGDTVEISEFGLIGRGSNSEMTLSTENNPISLGAGRDLKILGGRGGAGTVGAVGGAGADLFITSGLGGVDGGFGRGRSGEIEIGAPYTGATVAGDGNILLYTGVHPGALPLDGSIVLWSAQAAMLIGTDLNLEAQGGSAKLASDFANPDAVSLVADVGGGILLEVNSQAVLRVSDTAAYPGVDNVFKLGQAANRWSELHATKITATSVTATNGVRIPQRVISGTDTILITDRVVLLNTTGVTVTLPDSATVGDGWHCYIRALTGLSGSPVTLAAAGTNVIESGASYSLAVDQGDWHVWTDGAGNWYFINRP